MLRPEAKPKVERAEIRDQSPAGYSTFSRMTPEISDQKSAFAKATDVAGRFQLYVIRA